MKTKLLYLLSLICIHSIPSFAGDKFEVNGITYEVNSSVTIDGVLTKGNVSVISGTHKYSGDIVIPSEVTYNNFTYTVDKINYNAFYNCEDLTSVAIPSSIIYIGSSAFYNCNKLTTLSIPNSVKEFGSGAVNKCSGILLPIYNASHFVYMPEEYEGDYSIPYGIECVINNAFDHCTRLNQITFPHSVKEIGTHAFSSCTNLSSVELSEGLEKIGSSAFYLDQKLGSIILPSTLKEIGSSAFSGTGIKSIILPANVEAIEGNPFDNCSELESIVVDSNNRTYNSRNNCNAIIKENVLCVGCKNTIIPDGVTTIAQRAFSSCKGLLSISIPSSTMTIEDFAFSSCTNLSSVELSEGLEKIGTSAFHLDQKLESIILPSTLKEIGSSAFNGCGLKDIVSEISDPFVIEKSVFDDYSHNCYNNAILYVKQGKISVYRETDGWNEFKNIQEAQADINFADGTFSYILSQIRKEGTIIDLNSENDNIIIPEAVTYQGTMYTINKIKDRAFAEKKLVTVTFPEQNQTLGTGMFEGSYKLSAIVWNRSDRPSDELIRSIESPNVLFYVKSEDVAPTNLTNVIVNNVAKNIVLVDAPETSFYCPQEFTAENISYTHTYSLKTEKGVVQGWESIALPFDVQKYETADGEAKPYAVATSGEKLFWLRELTDTGFKETTGIKANVPYIISMPNWEGYQDFYNIEGDVTFSAQNATVPKTAVENVVYGNRIFWPCFSTMKSQSDIYVLNKERIEFSNSSNVYLPGSSFMAGLRKASPFECYFTYSGASLARALSLNDMMGDDATGIIPILYNDDMKVDGDNVYINCSDNETLNIYTLSGQNVKSLKLNKGQNVVCGLTKGIYVIKGKKIAIQ